MLKKTVMRQYWRIQQSQTLISMGFWCTTLTLLIWPLVSWRFEEMDAMMGIPSTYLGLIGLSRTMVILTMHVFLFVFSETFCCHQGLFPMVGRFPKNQISFWWFWDEAQTSTTRASVLA